ncbi:hypothetical protein FXO38_18938 [Capsicum annuum]|nr:hypothetical protein FXO38_18938 [Capsicum annuum]KAF3650081.1 hypothetical protein FXO37_18624 [Capsicum annuum]
MENKDRTWMYIRLYPNRAGLREVYKAGIAEFIAKAMTLNDFLIERTIRYPCWNCKCCKLLSLDVVTLHLYRKDFMLNYTVWTAHGKSSAANNFAFQNYVKSPIRENNVESSRYSEMVRDGFGTHSGAQNEPNGEAKHFYEQLKEASHLLYEGSVHSKLSIVVQLLSIKSDYSISQEGMNFIIGLMNELNLNKRDLPKDFYTTKKLVSKLGLSSERIHCCEKGCMLFYKEDSNLGHCKFCNQPRYKKVRHGKGKKVPVKSMHYLPLIPRLKRLYASISFASHMRWHYENKRGDVLVVNKENQWPQKFMVMDGVRKDLIIFPKIPKFKEVVEYDGNGRLIISSDDNGFIPAYAGGYMVIETIKPFYTESWGSWNEILLYIRVLMWNQFVDQFLEKWDTPKYRERRKRAKANRASQTGGSLHTGGSMSFSTHRRKLEYENGGKEHPFIDVYETTHRKKNKDGTRGDWVEPRAKNAYEEFQKSIEEWRQTQPTSKNGTMVHPSPEELNNMWTTVVGGPKKGRTYRIGVLQSSSSPSLFSSSSSTLQTMEEMKVMKKQIVELTQKFAANDAKFAKFDKLEELVKKHMPQVFQDEKDIESDDN